MNLEEVEQRCFNYLKQVSNPLVPIDTLLRHLRQDESMAAITESELLEFLRKHELFKVVDPPNFGSADPTAAQRAEGIGIVARPRVILDTRIPTESDLSQMMREELARVLDALEKARREAAAKSDETQVQHLNALVARAAALLQKLQQML